MYQLHISLDGFTPAITRSVTVPEIASLYKFYQVIQAAIGWANSHLYHFIDHNNDTYDDPLIWEDSEFYFNNLLFLKPNIV